MAFKPRKDVTKRYKVVSYRYKDQGITKGILEKMDDDALSEIDLHFIAIYGIRDKQPRLRKMIERYYTNKSKDAIETYNSVITGVVSGFCNVNLDASKDYYYIARNPEYAVRAAVINKASGDVTVRLLKLNNETHVSEVRGYLTKSSNFIALNNEGKEVTPYFMLPAKNKKRYNSRQLKRYLKWLVQPHEDYDLHDLGGVDDAFKFFMELFGDVADKHAFISDEDRDEGIV